MIERLPPEGPPGAVRRVHYPLSRPPRLTVDAVARRSGVHPDLIRRFVALGVLDATRDASGGLWFRPQAPATVARIQRLRASLSLNYAAVGLVLDLLDRITELESALRRGGLAVPPPLGRE
jgi:chaperone modulatory protein CbpM